jgi:hypothetical protein
VFVGESGKGCNEVTFAVSIKTGEASWLLPRVPSGFNGWMSVDHFSYFLTAVADKNQRGRGECCRKLPQDEGGIQYTDIPDCGYITFYVRRLQSSDMGYVYSRQFIPCAAREWL